VGIASRRNYWTIGLHVDSDDWKQSNPDSIVANVLRDREMPRITEATNQDSARNVVLLHDAGGDRSGTVRALGPLIDSLRARGDTLVLVSELAGITRDDAMPPMPATTEATRLFMRIGFLTLGLGETVDEVLQVMRDLRAHQVAILTLGQYLRPSPKHLPIVRYVPPAEFDELRRAGLEMGFAHVEAGPLVRSSYHAADAVR
jgi:hypothetical protein